MISLVGITEKMMHSCGTETNYFGSGSGKVSVPFWIRIHTIFSTVFQLYNCVQNLAIFLLETALLPRKLSYHLQIFYFFDFCHSILSRIQIKWGSESRSVMHWVPVPIRQKFRFLWFRFHNTGKI